MFEIGDYVLNATNGICKISGNRGVRHVRETSSSSHIFYSALLRRRMTECIYLLTMLIRGYVR